MTSSNSHCPDTLTLEAWLTADLAELEAQQVDEHVANCATCDATASQLESVLNLRWIDRPPAESVELRDELLAEIVVRAKSLEKKSPPRAISEHWASIPQVIGDYTLQARIGHGGMGCVYRAHHGPMDRLVALKLLSPLLLDDASAQQRFRREMQALGKLDHPHVVRAFDSGRSEAGDYLAMEYVQGVDIGSLLEAQSPNVEVACEILRQTAVGLKYIHSQGLIHRDIKPSNLMLDCQGVIKILDLGLAKFAQRTVLTHELTASSQLLGSIDYMAPEQGRAGTEMDARVDIYSLGATFFKLLTGRVVLDGADYDTAFKKLAALATAEVPSIIGRCGNTPSELVTLCSRMLEADPADRLTELDEVIEIAGRFSDKVDLRSVVSAFDEQRAKDPTTYVNADVTDRHAESSASADSLERRADSNEALGTRGPTPPIRGRRLGPGTFLLLLLVFSAAAVWYLQLEHGVVRIEVADPQIEVRLVDGALSIEGIGRKSLRLRPGEHGLRIKRGRTEFEVVQFEVKRRGSVAIRVEYQEGEVLVVKDKERAMAALALPAPAPRSLPPEQPPPDKPIQPAVKPEQQQHRPQFARGMIPHPHPIDGIRRWQIYAKFGNVKRSRVMESPDGRYLGQIVDLGQPHDRLRWPQPELRVYEIASKKLVYLSPIYKTSFSPVWSSTSQSIAIEGEGQARNLDGTFGEVGDTFGELVDGAVRGPSWHANCLEELQALDLNDHPRYGRVAWHPDGQSFAVCAAQRDLQEVGMYCVRHFSVVGKLLGEWNTSGSVELSWSASGSYLAAAGLDDFWVWNVRDSEQVYHFADKSTLGVAFHPQNDELLAISAELPCIVEWQDEESLSAKLPARNVARRSREKQPRWRLRWSRDGRYLAGCTAARMRVVTADDRLVFDNDEVKGALNNSLPMWSTDAKRLYVGYHSWSYLNLDGVQIEITPVTKGGYSCYMDVHPQGKAIWALGKMIQTDGSPGPDYERAWDHKFPYSGHDIPAFGPQGRRLAVSCNIGLVIRDTEEYRVERLLFPLPDGQHATFSLAGELLFATERATQQFVYLVETDTGVLQLLDHATFQQKYLD